MPVFGKINVHLKTILMTYLKHIHKELDLLMLTLAVWGKKLNVNWKNDEVQKYQSWIGHSKCNIKIILYLYIKKPCCLTLKSIAQAKKLKKNKSKMRIINEPRGIPLGMSCLSLRASTPVKVNLGSQCAVILAGASQEWSH